MATVIILGNGKSRDLYSPDDFDDDDTYVIGCNVPPKDTEVDFVCAVDAYAVSHAYRKGQPHHDRLVNESWKLVLGPRAANGLRKCKAVPGGVETLLEWIKSEKHLHKKIPLFPDAKEVGQRYFSTGHMSFVFACEEWPDSDIHFFGFDSLFTGAAASYTHWAIRRPDDPTQLKRQPKGVKHDKPDPTVEQWQWLWTRVFDSDKNTARTINIHGFNHDPDLTYIHDSIDVIRHDKSEIADEKFQTD